MSLIRLCLLTLLPVMGALSLRAQTVDDLNKQADDLVHNLKEEDALQQYKSVLSLKSDNLHALIWCSVLSARMGARQTEKSPQKDYYTQAQNYASQALQADSNSSEANCAMAIAETKLSQIESGKKRLALYKDIKGFCDKAIHLDKSNYMAWHVLGDWDYTVSHMSGAEKAGLRISMSGFPDATIKDAIHSYETCRSLNRSFIINYLTLAKAYREDDQNENALAALQTLVHLPVQTQDDPQTKEEGRKTLDAMM